jgi:hypothetical protein
MGKHSKQEAPRPRLKADGGRLYIEFYDHTEAFHYASQLNAAVAGGSAVRNVVFFAEKMPDKAA